MANFILEEVGQEGTRKGTIIEIIDFYESKTE